MSAHPTIPISVIPYGDQDDSAALRLLDGSSSFYLWNLTRSNDWFLLVSVYDDADMSYIVGDHVDVAAALDERVKEVEHLVEFGPVGSDGQHTKRRLLNWGFYSLLDRLTSVRNPQG